MTKEEWTDFLSMKELNFKMDKIKSDCDRRIREIKKQQKRLNNGRLERL